MKTPIIFFFCMIFANLGVSSQANPLQPNTDKALPPFPYLISTASFIRSFEKEVVSPKFYTSNLGFFCKQELKIQAITKIPVKIRVGSVQYCDWMEGKKNAGWIPGH